MEPIACVGPNGGPVSREVLEEKAAERDPPPGVEQRRDESGQFVSHSVVPDRESGEQ